MTAPGRLSKKASDAEREGKKKKVEHVKVCCQSQPCQLSSNAANKANEEKNGTGMANMRPGAKRDWQRERIKRNIEHRMAFCVWDEVNLFTPF